MGLSIRAFADKIGVNKATIVNWEQGRHTPKGLSLKVLERMAKRVSKQSWISWKGRPLIPWAIQPVFITEKKPWSGKDFDFSYSGVKTAFQNLVKESKLKDPNFIKDNIYDLCASLQKSLVESIIRKIDSAAKKFSISENCNWWRRQCKFRGKKIIKGNIY